MPPKAPKAPPVTAPTRDHKKHADEFLRIEDFKKKPDDIQDRSDEAKP